MLNHRPADHQRRGAADRKRRSRARRRKGLVLPRVEADEYELIKAPQVANKLSVDDGLRRKEVESAVGKLVEDFIARWKPVTRVLRG
jgi:hypothetical protein